MKSNRSERLVTAPMAWCCSSPLPFSILNRLPLGKLWAFKKRPSSFSIARYSPQKSPAILVSWAFVGLVDNPQLEPVRFRRSYPCEVEQTKPDALEHALVLPGGR